MEKGGELVHKSLRIHGLSQNNCCGAASKLRTKRMSIRGEEVKPD